MLNYLKTFKELPYLCIDVFKSLIPLLLFLYTLTVVFYFFKKQVIGYFFFYKITLFFIFFITSLSFYEFLTNERSFLIHFIKFKGFEFVKVPLLGLYFDKLSLFFTITVLTISFFTVVFQNTYTFDFLQKERFLTHLNFFILSMVFLILSNNWVLLLLCWAGLGISSFFLIKFFKNKTSFFKSSFKAFFFNKISDLFLLLSCLSYYKLTGTLDTVNGFDFFKNSNNFLYEKSFCLFLTVSAFIKSAQLFFFFWLPDSMEAPIPASALIHSATLVSAGIYLILRFDFFYNHFFNFKKVLLVFSTVSMVLFSLTSCCQSDIKKILAFSTISNCAFIYFLIGLGELKLSLFFFSIHGFFKSLCFLTFGLLIVFNGHNQDLKKWNKLTFSFNFLTFLFVFQTLSLSGFPNTIAYLLKTRLTTIFVNDRFLLYTIHLSLILYSTFSYFYGLKILFLLNKQDKFYLNQKEVSLNNVRNSVFMCLTYSITVVFVLVTSIVFFLKLRWTDVFFFFNFIGFFFLSTILLFVKKKNYNVILGFFWGCLTLVLI